MPRMPDTGKTGKMLASKMISSMPIQNTGAAKPTRDITLMSCDSQPLGLREDKTPSVVPIKNAVSTEVSTSSSVAGTRSRIRSDTGRLKK